MDPVLRVLRGLWGAWAKVAGAALRAASWVLFLVLYALLAIPLRLFGAARLGPSAGWTPLRRQTRTLEDASEQF